MRPSLPHARLVLTTVAFLAACADVEAPAAPTARPNRSTAADASAASAGATLVVTELMSDPSRVVDTDGEWLEIHNPGDAPVDLAGWQIASGPTVLVAGGTPSERHTIAGALVVPAKGFVVLGVKADPAVNGGAPVNYAYGSALTLNNSTTDWVTLKTPTGALVDSVAYSPSTVSGTTRTIGTPTHSPRAGTSRLVVDAGADNTILADANWRFALDAETYGAGDRGTPGTGSYGPVVPPGPATSVIVAPASALVGRTVTLSATAYDSAQRPTPSTYTWESLDPSIATVDAATGVATAVSGGSVTVRATAANGVAGMGTLTVTIPGGTARITFSGRTQSDPALPIGFEDQLFTTTFDAAGARNNQPITWGTTTPELVSVDQRGVVRALAAGRASVTARSADGYTAAWTVLTADVPASTTAIYEGNAELGIPTDADASDDYVVQRRELTYSFSRTRATPNWVSYAIDPTHFGSLDRCDCFTPDPLLPADFPVVQTSDYTSGGYDRGHLARSFDRTAGALDNARTFYMSNIIPQTADNNQGPWAVLEDSLGKLVRFSGREVYVVAGVAGSLGTVKNEGKITIPAVTWKVAVVVPRDRRLADIRSAADVDEVIAVVMPNVSGIRNVPWTTYKVSVDSVQRLSGYDLLDRLPNNLEIQLETGNRAPVAAAGGNDAARTSYLGAEGAAVTFAGSATDADANDVLSYAWSFGDGATARGATATHAYAQNGEYEATLVVTDARGAVDTARVAVRIANVSPVVAAFEGATILRGERYATSGRFADAGTRDQWTATVDFGTGSGAQSLALDGAAFSLSHTYATAGTRTVTVTVRDADGGAGTQTATVAVLTPRQGVDALRPLIAALGTPTGGALGDGELRSLQAKADASARRLDGDQTVPAAINTLQALLNELDALQQGGRLTAAQAAPVADYARRIVRSLGG